MDQYVTGGNAGSTTPGRFAAITARLRLPLIVAPMFRVSGPELVIAACRSGAIGAFPTANARSVEVLDAWLATITAALGEAPHPLPPFCPNLIINQPRLKDDLDCLTRHKVELLITSVGSPRAVVPVLHKAGCLVFSDVASLAHAHKAIAAGVDGLVLLTAGAGGQPGWLNGFAFVRAVRAFFDGPIVLAGGISDGTALRAAEVLGCTLGYMGTRFIASSESMASDAYKKLVLESTMDDVLLTKAFTGLATNMLLPSITAAGLDPDTLEETVTPQTAAERYGGGAGSQQRWSSIVSAGHSVSGATDIQAAAVIIEKTREEYHRAGGCWPQHLEETRARGKRPC